uniref:Uncharacterized protein n=1 Tax=Pelusios castaneus TaxID=367368 RepID=A0A8C8STH0_9SAUR
MGHPVGGQSPSRLGTGTRLRRDVGLHGQAGHEGTEVGVGVASRAGEQLTFAPVALEVHVAPLAIIDLLVAGSHLDATRAHVQQQVEVAIQQLHGKVVSLVWALSTALPRGLEPPMAKEQQPVGLGGAEVKGDGACLLGVPLGQGDVGLGRLKGDRVQRRHVLAAEH